MWLFLCVSVLLAFLSGTRPVSLSPWNTAGSGNAHHSHSLGRPGPYPALVHILGGLPLGMAAAPPSCTTIPHASTEANQSYPCMMCMISSRSFPARISFLDSEVTLRLDAET